ncbi:MAG: hypothetical protein JO057_23770 [Chloroflexi bacterium]|nr:hypothetical protein [Chloroflexota bacterium]
MAESEAPKPASAGEAKPDDKAEAVKPGTKIDADELTEAELDEIVGGIGGSNGKVSSGTGSNTPPPTAPPRAF